MNRTIELLRLTNICNPIEGRKKLQKMVHILQEAGYPFDFPYGFHFHGPFSVAVKEEIEELVSQGLVEEQAGRTPSGEYALYRYTVTPAARELLPTWGASDIPAWEALARTLNDKSSQELEAISTILFLQRYVEHPSELKSRFQQLKPHLTHWFDSSLRFIANSVRPAMK